MSLNQSTDATVQAAYDRLIDLSVELRHRVGALAQTLKMVQEAGVEIRASDVSMLKNRFHDQLAIQLERKAGALLGPITGQINIDLDVMSGKTSGEKEA